MTRKVLLDTNLLIAAFDHNGTTSVEVRQKAKQKLEELLIDNEVAFCITPLIRYEVLRGISWGRKADFQNLQIILNEFTELDVTSNVSELAANLFRFDTEQNQGVGRNIEKRKFDVFHLASAKCNGLELASEDTDIAKLEGLYTNYLQEIAVV
ncbi:type II toxin-antitoxin system VapC family toxin [Hafnia alvei]|jgi:predicted nucleic acid-binding protein|uniref:type II toxin-antitoxin system VapC family toxin n=1 Tax=Hafnia alvei TaxID=569 RepID=UPI00103D2844|nr:PIN domain-containing protein [Hafnia alvei]QBJ31932.1 PIN domain-containing protein [Hafnia alvei]